MVLNNARLPLVDALRGIAVIAMVYIHVQHAFSDPARTPHDFNTASNFFGGWAAPTFLFLAGLSAAWASAKTSPSTLAWRGCEVWLWAMAFRFQEWLVGGVGARAADMLRVDVLNCIGVSLVLVAAALALTRRHAWLLAVIGASFFGFTETVRHAAWLAELAPQIAWYVAGPPQMAPFPTFGWTGFAFFGAALGLVASGPDRNRTLLRAATLALILYLPIFILRSYSPAVVGFEQSDFNAYNMVERLALTVALFSLANLLTPLHGWLALLGRHSMIIYWVHVELCYGLLFYHWQRKQPVPVVLAIALVMMIAMSFLARGQERLVDWAETMMIPALRRWRTKRTARA